MAINAAITCGFNTIISLEISEMWYEHCMNLFKSHTNVYLYNADSSIHLYDVIKEVDTPITFWLDGHWSGGDTGFGKDKYPILSELKQIARHHRKDHTILIDDVRLFNSQWGLSDRVIKDYLLRINPYFKFKYEDGYVQNDVLVAKV